METALYVIHIFVCLAMLPIILMQSGKGGGVSAAFGGGSSQSVFGSRGASTLLTKMTTGAALVFMITSLALSYVSSGSKSVVGDLPPLEQTTEGVAPTTERPVEATPPAPAENVDEQEQPEQ